MIWFLFCSITAVWFLALFGFGLFISIRFVRSLFSLHSTSHVSKEEDRVAASNYAIATRSQASTV